MGSAHSSSERSVPGLDRQDPYFSLHFVVVFVRDEERSLRFCVDQLGFRPLADHRFEPGVRWIEVAPPDGSANLAFVPVPPNSEIVAKCGVAEGFCSVDASRERCSGNTDAAPLDERGHLPRSGT